jgi:hypothetical protein
MAFGLDNSKAKWLQAFLQANGFPQVRNVPPTAQEAGLLGLKPPPTPLGANTSFDMKGATTPKRARMAAGLPEDELQARRDFLAPKADYATRGGFQDERYQQASRDESRLTNLLTQALDPTSRRFDSVDSGRDYQKGLAVNTTDNSRRGQRYATFTQGGNLYHEYVINGRRRKILVGPAARKLF